MLNMDMLHFENNVDPDQMASDEAIWSESTVCSFSLYNHAIWLHHSTQMAVNFL